MKMNTLIILILISMLIWGGIFMLINHPDIAKIIFFSGSVVSLLLGLNEMRYILKYI